MGVPHVLSIVTVILFSVINISNYVIRFTELMGLAQGIVSMVSTHDSLIRNTQSLKRADYLSIVVSFCIFRRSLNVMVVHLNTDCLLHSGYTNIGLLCASG
jgi:hypothetical protein